VFNVWWFVFGLATAYPLASTAQHGLDPRGWASASPSAGEWFQWLLTWRFQRVIETYSLAAAGHADGLPHGGWTPWLALGWLPFFASLFISARPPEPARHFSNVFGAARFADDGELSKLRKGLEIGVDGGGNAVRLAVEGTLVSIAPPRKGKTQGLLIPNLLFPEEGSWGGPAVVIDPKGEIFKAVSARREKLGRKVICLDPLNLCGGTDRLNPLVHVDETDILYFQHIAGCLLPQASGRVDEASTYFRNRAIDLVTAAILGCCYASTKTIVDVQKLLTSESKMQGILQEIAKKREEPAIESALEILAADAKTKDPIRSTALQAFQWLADARMRDTVTESTFDLADLTTGKVDLFVAVPPEYRTLLAPWLRWLLADLFLIVRRTKVQSRIVAFVDEAASLGRFDEVLTAAAELPGHGLSLWTFWQDRSQIVDLYGEAGAATIVNTAECVTISDFGAVDPREAERWSSAIGNYTALIETSTRPATGSGQVQIAGSPQAAPLMSKEELFAMPSNTLLAFPNSGSHTRHPIKLFKTLAYDSDRHKHFVAKAAGPIKAN
jgi:type IV secretion system protein VirD4